MMLNKFFKECLKIRHVNTPFFLECLLCESTMQNKIGFIVTTYQSSSPTADEFSKFKQNLDELFNQNKYLKSSFAAVLGDFNATIMGKIVETNSSFHMNYRIREKFSFYFSATFCYY